VLGPRPAALGSLPSVNETPSPDALGGKHINMPGHAERVWEVRIPGV